MAVVAVGGYFIWQFYLLDALPAASKASGSVIFLGAVAAICGWLFTSAVQLFNRVRQHTMTLIHETRFNDTYLRNSILIQDRFRAHGHFSEREAEAIIDSDAEADKEFRRALSRVLNFYEYLAIAVFYRDANERLLREFFVIMVVDNFRNAEPFHRVWQRRYGPDAGRNIERLYRRWLPYYRPPTQGQA